MPETNRNTETTVTAKDVAKRIENGNYTEETVKVAKDLAKTSPEYAERILNLEDSEREAREAENRRIEKAKAERIFSKIETANARTTGTNGLPTGTEAKDLELTVRYLAGIETTPPTAPTTKAGNKNEYGARYGVDGAKAFIRAGILDETPEAIKYRSEIKRKFA